MPGILSIWKKLQKSHVMNYSVALDQQPGKEMNLEWATEEKGSEKLLASLIIYVVLSINPVHLDITLTLTDMKFRSGHFHNSP